MAHGKFVVGQVGATFRLKVEEDVVGSGDIPFDLTGAEVSDIDMLFNTPDGRSKGPFPATIVSGTTDEMEFKTTDSSFLDIDGQWRYRGIITTTNGDTPPTNFATEQVIK